jgi:hypothetical protein
MAETALHWHPRQLQTVIQGTPSYRFVSTAESLCRSSLFPLFSFSRAARTPRIGTPPSTLQRHPPLAPQPLGSTRRMPSSLAQSSLSIRRAFRRRFNQVYASKSVAKECAPLPSSWQRRSTPSPTRTSPSLERTVLSEWPPQSTASSTVTFHQLISCTVSKHASVLAPSCHHLSLDLKERTPNVEA